MLTRYLLVLLPLGLLFFGATTACGTPHRFSDARCASCHITDPSAGRLILVEDLDSQCLGCHAIQSDGSHPHDVEPSMPLPSEFWTDHQGRLSCASCHDPHPEQGESSPFLLRGSADGTAFCAGCHGETVPHRSVVFVAHGKTYTPPAESGAVIDPVSDACLVCHDPGSAKAGVCILGQQGHCAGHIVGLNYDQASGGNPELRPSADLSPLVSLYNGKIGCASCHSIYSGKTAMLVMSNEKSALCFACHIK